MDDGARNRVRLAARVFIPSDNSLLLHKQGCTGQHGRLKQIRLAVSATQMSDPMPCPFSLSLAASNLLVSAKSRSEIYAYRISTPSNRSNAFIASNGHFLVAPPVSKTTKPLVIARNPGVKISSRRYRKSP